MRVGAERKRFREFTKEHHQEQRTALAQEIRHIRRQELLEQQSLDLLIERIQGEVEAGDLQVSDLAAEIAQLETDQEKIAEKFLAKVLHFIELQSVRKKLGTTQQLSRLTESVTEFKRGQIRTFQEARTLQMSKSKITTLLKDFSHAHRDEVKEYSEIQKNTSLREVADRENCLFLHGTLNYASPTAALENDGILDWVDKMNVVASVPVDIGSFTFDEHTVSQGQMFGEIGVVLYDGEITNAKASDQGSTKGSRGRTPYATLEQKAVLAGEIIPRAIHERGDRYNEFTVRNPNISGIWYNFEPNDFDRKKRLQGLGGAEKIRSKAESFGVPLYILHQGKAYEPLAEVEGDLRLGREVSLESVRKRPPIFMSDERSNRIFSEVVNRTVFTKLEQQRLPQDIHQKIYKKAA